MGSEKNDSTSFPPSEPILCANGCGFFGTAANMNLCSKCYREIRAQEEQSASAKAAMEKTLSIKTKQENFVTDNTHEAAEPVVIDKSSSSSSVSSQVTAAAGAAVDTTGDQLGPPKATNRCFVCNKKVGLTGFKCKCEGTFCGNHRYPENHDCSFDFKESGRSAIAKANPVIKADKVERI